MSSLDSLHPDRLRCGHALPVAPDTRDDPGSLRLLTEEEAAAYGPGLAADLRVAAALIAVGALLPGDSGDGAPPKEAPPQSDRDEKTDLQKRLVSPIQNTLLGPAPAMK
jgi:hypothetical protein